MSVIVSSSVMLSTAFSSVAARVIDVSLDMEVVGVSSDADSVSDGVVVMVRSSVLLKISDRCSVMLPVCRDFVFVGYRLRTDADSVAVKVAESVADCENEIASWERVFVLRVILGRLLTVNVDDTPSDIERDSLAVVVNDPSKLAESEAERETV